MKIQVLIALVWVIRIIGNLMSFIHLWYVKEYRWDRMMVHFRRTRQGKMLLFIPWRIPPFTPKTMLISIFSVLTLILLYVFQPVTLIWKIFILDLITFPVVSFWVTILGIPTRMYHRRVIARAREIIASRDNLLTVGITGSYGKSSTKEYLYTILSQKYQTLKTQTSKNSAIGVSEVILNHLKPDYERFVVEMGAYKTHDIEEMALISRPQVGIITAINAQHQDLFGSLENTIRTKYELIQNLYGKRIGIFNADNEFTFEMAERAKKEEFTVFIYTLRRVIFKTNHVFWGEKIKATLNGLEMTVKYNHFSQPVMVPLLGKHQAQNILAAIAGAVALGMTFNEAVRAARLLRANPKTMEPLAGINGSLFINDTFNNNPDAAKAAIEFLKLSKGKRILVFQPMIELGEFTDVAHREIGTLAAQICDEILLTNDNFNAPFMQGVLKAKKRVNLRIASPKGIAEHLAIVVAKDDTVVFKGKEAELSLSLLTK